METYICTCNNCANIYLDSNPGSDSTKFDLLPSVASTLQELERIDDMRACPVCRTDGYLVDNINVNAFNVNALITAYLKYEIEKF